MRTCGECSHAALYAGGVYCMEFNESILDEAVAEDCGVFELADPPLIAASRPARVLELVTSPRSTSVEPADISEAERAISVRVDAHYFGRPHQGDQLFASFVALCALHLPGQSEVTRLG